MTQGPKSWRSTPPGRSSSRHIVQTPHSAGHAGHTCRAALAGAALLGASLSTQAVPWVVQVRNAAGAPIAGVVVAVQVDGQAAQASPQTTAQMAQRARQFEPHVLVVQTGTAVSFPNFDTVRHHVYSFSAAKTFDIKLYAGTPANPVVFDSAGVATLGCNIHDRMSAHVVVVDTPLFAKSDAAGTATLRRAGRPACAAVLACQARHHRAAEQAASGRRCGRPHRPDAGRRRLGARSRRECHGTARVPQPQTARRAHRRAVPGAAVGGAGGQLRADPSQHRAQRRRVDQPRTRDRRTHPAAPAGAGRPHARRRGPLAREGPRLPFGAGRRPARRRTARDAERRAVQPWRTRQGRHGGLRRRASAPRRRHHRACAAVRRRCCRACRRPTRPPASAPGSPWWTAAPTRWSWCRWVRLGSAARC